MPYTIEEIKEKATPIAIQYGVGDMSLFGSYARGEADEQSDIDLYVEKGDFGSLFRHSAMRLDLEDAFGCPVDLVSLSGDCDRDFYDEVTREGIKIYEGA